MSAQSELLAPGIRQYFGVAGWKATVTESPEFLLRIILRKGATAETRDFPYPQVNSDLSPLLREWRTTLETPAP